MPLWSSRCACAAVGCLISAEDGSSTLYFFLFFFSGRAVCQSLGLVWAFLNLRFWFSLDGLVVIPWTSWFFFV